jgi:alpha-beta hydrolase superfamily lysophospholipase
MPSSPSTSLRFDNSPPSLVDGVRCRLFVPRNDETNGPASAALYEPEQPAASRPLILVQHGGSSHKQGMDVWDAAGALAGGSGCRVIALDGPVHGARRPEGAPDDGPSTRARFFALWENDPAHVDQHVARWRSLADELSAAYPASPLHWMGLSMGTAYGLPLLAVEHRFARAVLGMWGTSFVNSGRLAEDARRVRCPVLFQQKWDDELFTRNGQLQLFDALGCTDKRLHVHPGGHVRVQNEQMEDIVHFLAGRVG